jgi:hypothetical protein
VPVSLCRFILFLRKSGLAGSQGNETRLGGREGGEEEGRTRASKGFKVDAFFPLFFFILLFFPGGAA